MFFFLEDVTSLVVFVVERQFAKHKFIEMEIGSHLEDVGWILKESPYLNLEKGMELCKHCQVSGNFCLKQTSFL